MLQHPPTTLARASRQRHGLAWPCTLVSQQQITRPVTVRCQSCLEAKAPAALLSRRAVLTLTPLVGVSTLLGGGESEASALRSLHSQKQVTLTIYNATGASIDVYWINYDGDQELFAVLESGTGWIVDTYETHPFRFASTETGQVLQEYVVSGDSQQLVQVQRPAASGSSSSSSSSQQADTQSANDDSSMQASSSGRAEAPQIENVRNSGFDGLGNSQSDYVLATVTTVTVLPTVDASVVSLGLEGYEQPLNLLLGIPEARLLVNAAGSFRGRRPSTMATWRSTLAAAQAKVQRVVITRLVDEVFYARIVMTLPGGAITTVDSRPSDALCLAAATDADIYVNRSVAEIAQQDYEDAVDMLGQAPMPGQTDLLLDYEGAPSA